MSKLYNQYTILKINNPNKFFLFKCGIFLIFLDEDAKMMSKILNLKLGNLNSEIVKCGFPEISLNKYLNILNALNYEVEIVDMPDNSQINSQKYLENLKTQNVIQEILETDVDKLSISQTYDFLTKIQKELSEIFCNNVGD